MTERFEDRWRIYFKYHNWHSRVANARDDVLTAHFSEHNHVVLGLDEGIYFWIYRIPWIFSLTEVSSYHNRTEKTRDNKTAANRFTMEESEKVGILIGDRKSSEERS